MALSRTDVANLALTELGEQPINDIGDQKATAEVIRLIYDPTRDWVLRDYPWNFAIKRASLAAEVSGPVWSRGDSQDESVYALPSDCLKALDINNSSIHRDLWRVESGKIITAIAAPLELLYIRQVTLESDFDASFVKAFSLRLAAELAEKIQRNNDVAKRLEEKYIRVVADARSSDGQEGTPRAVNSDGWDQARYSGSTYWRGMKWWS